MVKDLVKIVLSDGRTIQDGQVEYVIAKNGVFKKVQTNVIEGYVKVNGVPHLPEINTPVKIKLPAKIPAQIYFQIYSFFCEYDTEVYAQIFWNESTKSYFVYVPKQIVTGASVDYKRNTKLERRFKLVCEIHSHNSMGAFFSGTDNEDEQTGVIYGVISTKGLFENKFRIKLYDSEWDIDVSEIFDLPKAPAHWSKSIKTNEQTCLPGYLNFGGNIVNAKTIKEKYGVPINDFDEP